MDSGVGAFWGRSPPVPLAEFASGSTSGATACSGDAVGLRASGDKATIFTAWVTLVANFDGGSLHGRVDRFRTIDGQSMDDHSIMLNSTQFPNGGDALNGESTAGIPGGGTWGARWSDGEGWPMGGTFGFAAEDRSVAVLGAFKACSCNSATGGNPDDAVATSAR